MSSSSIVSSPNGGVITYNFNCYENIRAHLCRNLAVYVIGPVEGHHEKITIRIANKIATVVSIIFSSENDVSEREFQVYLSCVMNNLCVMNNQEDFGFNDPQKFKTIIEKILKKPDLSSSSSSSPLRMQVPRALISSPESRPSGDLEYGLGLGLPSGPVRTAGAGASFIGGALSSGADEGVTEACARFRRLDTPMHFSTTISEGHTAELSLDSPGCSYSSPCPYAGSAAAYRLFDVKGASKSTCNRLLTNTSSKSSMNSFYGKYIKPMLAVLGTLFVFLVLFCRKNRT